MKSYLSITTDLNLLTIIPRVYHVTSLLEWNTSSKDEGKWNALFFAFLIIVTLVALDRTCRFAVHFFERVHFTHSKKQRKAMKGLEQVSSTWCSLGRIHYVYHWGWGPEDFGEFFLERKGGMVNISEGRKGRIPIFLDDIERLSICNIITKQVKFLIF